MISNPTAGVYALVGFALFGLTLQPALARRFRLNLPAIYIGLGALAVIVGAPHISPFGSELQAKIITHASELIVIVSLTGAGLAIDTQAGFRRWNATWRLLGIAMPLTIAALVVMGTMAGLPLAAAILLGAALAPTDPVLARAVQVGGPGEGEDTTSIALTAEAGLNDGLAFPFVWAAIAVAAGSFSWGGFLSYDVLWRVGVGVAVGWLIGKALAWIVFSRVGDGGNERDNPLIVMLAATFLAYGLTEYLHAYGFLAVFIAARASRASRRDPDMEDDPEDSYTNAAHQEADQIEGILMVLLLLWFGTFVAAELWNQWTLTDLAIALALLLVVRPVVGWVALSGHPLRGLERFKVAFFGIRGMGTIFYVAFAQTHMPDGMMFEGIDDVWRIAGLCIFISVLMHETLAGVLFKEDGIPVGGDELA